MVAGILPCGIHDAIAVEVPFPLGDLVPRTGGDVAGVVRELDLIALDDLKREVGGEGHADPTSSPIGQLVGGDVRLGALVVTTTL